MEVAPIARGPFCTNNSFDVTRPLLKQRDEQVETLPTCDSLDRTIARVPYLTDQSKRFSDSNDVVAKPDALDASRNAKVDRLQRSTPR